MRKAINFIASGVLALTLAVTTSLSLAQTTHAATAPTLSRPCVTYLFSSGDNYECVKYIQKFVNSIYQEYPSLLGGARTPLVVDGKFGPLTKSAITNIQAHSYVITYGANKSQGTNIFLDKDGVVGPQTWAVICGAADHSNADIFNTLASAGCITISNGNYSYTYKNTYYGWGMTPQTH